MVLKLPNEIIQMLPLLDVLEKLVLLPCLRKKLNKFTKFFYNFSYYSLRVRRVDLWSFYARTELYC